jgi:DNA-binding SARP family transcriptional activator/ABC-type glycerol-3-phosphate transport system substrate-binding protein
MKFRILGALEVRDEGDRRIPLGAGKQRALLALLLLHASEVVPTDRLIDELWPESPPERARKAVQVYVTRLRKALGRERIRTQGPGYVLELDSDELDLHEFETRVQQARELKGHGDHMGAAIALREALALWHGPPLADFAYEPFAQTEIPRLEERRLEALEERIDSDLALGRGADLVGELEGLIAKHPFRERLRGQLMLALYRDGRQADALRVYQETRKLLVDELGIEPGRALQRLEGAVLRQEPALETVLETPEPHVAGRSRGRLALLVAAVIGIAVAAGIVILWRQDTEPAVGSAQNPITILSPMESSEKAAFVEVLKAFETKTRFKTQIEDAPNILPRMRALIAAGNPPMLAMIPTLGMLADLARDGVLEPLAQLGVSNRHLSRNYSQTWISLGVVDGETYAFPATATSKSVFWYRPDGLNAMGLTVPQTWEELLSVTRKIKAGGETPWALAAQDSWTLTDWFENVYLRTAGPANYSQLFAGKLRFDHGSVIAALRRMTTILNDRYVAGGLSSALKTDFFEGMFLVFGETAGALFYMEGGFVGSLALEHSKPKPKPGRTINLAAFPTIDPSVGSPLVGGINLAAAFDDNEALRELLLFLSSPEAARAWVSTGAVVSPNKRVPPSAYPNVLVRAEARQLADATVFVSDGSDLLPGSLGRAWGSTLQKVIREPENIPMLLKDFQREAARAFKK